MRYGTAKVGMRVRIIGNHNNHGFCLGETVELDRMFGAPTNFGCGFIAKSTNTQRHYSWLVREIDFKPIGGKVV